MVRDVRPPKIGGDLERLVSTSSSQNELHRITIIKGLCGGRPTIRGMRIRVHDILDLLAHGASRAEILADYSYLEDGDITAALQYASRQLDHPVLAAE
jgi:uncharacterized protein (DUF433 family)